MRHRQQGHEWLKVLSLFDRVGTVDVFWMQFLVGQVKSVFHGAVLSSSVKVMKWALPGWLNSNRFSVELFEKSDQRFFLCLLRRESSMLVDFA